MTWWFRIIIAAIVIGLLLAFHNYRISKRLEIERTRNRIARDLHDEIGSSLSSIALASDLLQKNNELEDKQNKRLTRIKTTSRKLIERMDDIVWSINPDYDKLDNLLLHMKDFAADLLTQSQIKYSLHFPKQEFSRILKMDFRRNLFLIYKELLHNIVKHANATYIEIVLTKLKSILVLKVSDNGTGFDPEYSKNGTGLKSMQIRAVELGGELEFESNNDQGTTVRLKLKIP